MEEEKHHITQALAKCGYPKWAFNRINNPKKDKPNTNKDSTTKSKGQVVIPYIKGFSEALRRIYGSYGIRGCFKPTSTLRQFLVAPKDKSEKKDITGPIYSIHCQGQTNRGQCEEFYIGETERSLKARFLEHRRPSSTSSEVSQHIHIESPGHKIDLEKVKILDREPRWFERGVKEAIYIRINQPTLNKDGGRYKLPNVYDPVLTSLPKVSNSRELGHSADESCSSNWKFQVHKFIVLWSKVKFIHLDLLPTQMNFHYKGGISFIYLFIYLFIHSFIHYFFFVFIYL